MIELTSTAAEKLQAIRASNPDHGAKALRLYVAGQSCSGYRYGMAFDDVSPDDTVADEGGIRVAVDPQSLPYVQGAKIDFVEAATGSGFTVKNPSVSSGGGGCGNGGCGCGGGGQ